MKKLASTDSTTVETTENSSTLEAIRTTRIADLNDAVRSRLMGCVMTSGVAELTPILSDILDRVRDYSSFTPDDDPYDEHDFGSFELFGIRFFWKIDYYDESLSGWCDPLDPRCHRQLTVMRADEY